MHACVHSRRGNKERNLRDALRRSLVVSLDHQNRLKAFEEEERKARRIRVFVDQLQKRASERIHSRVVPHCAQDVISLSSSTAAASAASAAAVIAAAGAAVVVILTLR